MRPANTIKEKLAIIKELQETVFGGKAIKITNNGYCCSCGSVGGNGFIASCCGFGETEELAILACWYEIDNLNSDQYLFNGLPTDPQRQYILNRQNEWACFVMPRS